MEGKTISFDNNYVPTRLCPLSSKRISHLHLLAITNRAANKEQQNSVLSKKIKQKYKKNKTIQFKINTFRVEDGNILRWQQANSK